MDLDGAHILTLDELVDELLEHMLLKFDGNGAAAVTCSSTTSIHSIDSHERVTHGQDGGVTAGY